jgi:hypothetical protein
MAKDTSSGNCKPETHTVPLNPFGNGQALRP